MKEEGIAVRAFHLRGGRSFSAPLRLPALRRAGRVDSGGFLSASSGAVITEIRFISVTRRCLLWARGPIFPDRCRDFFLQIASEVAVSAFRDETRYRSDGDRTRIPRIISPALSIASSETSLWVPLLFDKTPFSFSSKKKGCCWPQ